MKGLRKPKAKGLTEKEKAFANNYVVNGFNKTRAAIASGTKNEASARTMGCKMYNKPEVQKYIKDLIKQTELPVEQIKKIVQDVAVANLADYYDPVKVIKHHKVEIPLKVYIDGKKEDLLREKIYVERCGLQGKDLKNLEKSLEHSRLHILRLEIELERNPKATRIVESDPYLVEEMMLNINKVIADKERGRIKKFKTGREGTEIELYNAQDAVDKILRMKGEFKKDNEQQQAAKQVIIWNGQEITF